MSANVFGESGLVWGASEETGILCQSYSRGITGQEKEAKNHEGEDAGLSLYNPIAEHTVEGYVTGSTGIAAAEFGAALVIANAKSGNGVAAGLIICTGVTDTVDNEDFEMIQATARQRPLITA